MVLLKNVNENKGDIKMSEQEIKKTNVYGKKSNDMVFDISKNWYVCLVLLAIDLFIGAYFLSNGENMVIYSGVLAGLYLVLMPATGIYNKIFKNKFLIVWFIINACLMAAYGIHVIVQLF